MRNARAQDLRKRVTIQYDATTRSSSGALVAWTTPATLTTVGAAIEPVHPGGREIFSNTDWTTSVGAYRITMRYRSDVTTAMRILWNNRHFSIEAVPAVDARESRFMTLVCQEVK